jgi:hypothetical protein
VFVMSSLDQSTSSRYMLTRDDIIEIAFQECTSCDNLRVVSCIHGADATTPPRFRATPDGSRLSVGGVQCRDCAGDQDEGQPSIGCDCNAHLSAFFVRTRISADFEPDSLPTGCGFFSSGFGLGADPTGYLVSCSFCEAAIIPCDESGAWIEPATEPDADDRQSVCLKLAWARKLEHFSPTCAFTDYVRVRRFARRNATGSALRWTRAALFPNEQRIVRAFASPVGCGDGLMSVSAAADGAAVRILVCDGIIAARIGDVLPPLPP